MKKVDENIVYMHLKTIVTALFCIILDQLFKNHIITTLQQNQKVLIFPGIYKTFVWNKGVAFSMFSSSSNASIFFLIFISFSICAVLMYLMFSSKGYGKFYTLSITLMLSGGLSNIIDRVFYGAVIDYIYLSYNGYNWPTIFNFADMCICLGAALFTYWTMVLSPENKNTAPEKYSFE